MNIKSLWLFLGVLGFTTIGTADAATADNDDSKYLLMAADKPLGAEIQKKHPREGTTSKNPENANPDGRPWHGKTNRRKGGASTIDGSGNSDTETGSSRSDAEIGSGTGNSGSGTTNRDGDSSNEATNNNTGR